MDALEETRCRMKGGKRYCCRAVGMAVNDKEHSRMLVVLAKVCIRRPHASHCTAMA